MKLPVPSLLRLLAFSVALAPTVSLAEYQPAQKALDKLESIISLTSAQKDQALQIFQNLKVIMDDMDPADRPVRGAQSRQDALAAIRAILTPEQQAIYDRTPQRLGGDAKVDVVMQALNLKIRNFVSDCAKKSPEVAAQVGTVQKVAHLSGSATTSSSGGSANAVVHPDNGSNVVRVTGSSGTKAFKISWGMSASGEMTVTKVENAAN